ncbi:MAG: nitrate/nitrite transporter [Betaproteobacteria bacterium]
MSRAPDCPAVDGSAGLGLRIFVLFASGYVLSYALRTVNAVIAPELVAEFGLSNAELGALSSAYFFSFILMQLPLGVWLDRYGSRNTDAALLAVAACGCLLFAVASESWMLGLARTVIGVGVSGALMSGLRAFRFSFAPARQQRLAAWMLTAGTLGALVSTVPAQWAVPLIGWRGLFLLCAGLLAAAAVALRAMLPAEPAQAAVPRGAQWRAYGEVFREPYFWRFAVTAITLQGSFIAMQSLWAGPWLTRVLGMSAAQAAQALLVINVSLMCAYLVLGWATPRLAARGVSTLQIAAAGSVLMLIAQAWIGWGEGSWAWLAWVPYAIGVTAFTPVHTHVSLSFRSELTGRAFSAFNLLIFVGIFLSQWLFGVLVDGLQRMFALAEPTAFRSALGLWWVLQAGALAMMLGSRARPPAPPGR